MLGFSWQNMDYRIIKDSCKELITWQDKSNWRIQQDDLGVKM